MTTSQRFAVGFGRTVFSIVILNILCAAILVAAQRFPAISETRIGLCIGPVALLLPGVLIALTLEQLSRRRESTARVLLWGVIFSLTLLPAATYLLAYAVPQRFSLLQPLGAFLVTWAACGLLFCVAATIRRIVPGFVVTRLSRRHVRRLGFAVLLLLVILGVNFVLYRFIPEADGYGYLLTLRRAASDATVLVEEPRILFLSLLNLGATLLQIDPYWILKIGLPVLSGCMSVGTLYLATEALIRRPALRLIAIMSPFCFPVFLQELLIARPQSVVVLVLIPTLYLLGRIASGPPDLQQLYWLSALLVVGFVGLKIHTLFAVVILLAAIAIVLLLGPLIRKQPLDASIVLAVFIVFALPWLRAGRIFSDTWHIIHLFAEAVGNNHFRWWFLSSYRNVDGSEVGWPGWSGWLYYGYNLGLLLPAVLIGIVWLRRPFVRQLMLWPVWTLLIGFLIIAEVLPRFQFAFLPDRAWLFVAIACSFLLPYWLVTLDDARSQFMRVALGFVAIASICASSAVTYAKQGWITPSEYAAVDFLHNSTPSNAVFFGQGGTRVLVRYFADRTFLATPPALFLSNDTEIVDRYLSEEQQRQEELLHRREDERVHLGQQMSELGQQYQVADSSDLRTSLAVQQIQLSEDVVVYERMASQRNDTSIPANAPVYAIYSTDKFGSLYGQRAWWRASNLYGANLDKFSERYPLVYNEAGVMVWRVR